MEPWYSYIRSRLNAFRLWNNAHPNDDKIQPHGALEEMKEYVIYSLDIFKVNDIRPDQQA